MGLVFAAPMALGAEGRGVDPMAPSLSVTEAAPTKEVGVAARNVVRLGLTSSVGSMEPVGEEKDAVSMRMPAAAAEAVDAGRLVRIEVLCDDDEGGGGGELDGGAEALVGALLGG